MELIQTLPGIARDGLLEHGHLIPDGQIAHWRYATSDNEHREMLHDLTGDYIKAYESTDTIDERKRHLGEILEAVHSIAIIDEYNEGQLLYRSKVRTAESGRQDDPIITLEALRHELQKTPSASERLEILADMRNGIFKLAEQEGVSTHDLTELQNRQRRKNGSFLKGVIVIETVSK